MTAEVKRSSGIPEEISGLLPESIQWPTVDEENAKLTRKKLEIVGGVEQLIFWNEHFTPQGFSEIQGELRHLKEDIYYVERR